MSRSLVVLLASFHRRVAQGAWAAGAALWMSGAYAAAAAPAAPPTAPVLRESTAVAGQAEAVVEAVRQTAVAAQVPGAVVALAVKAGDTVSAGQVLMRLDARAAQQQVAAGDAQVRAAQASLDVATQEVERQRQLFEQRYISQGALERAEAQFKSTQAQVQAQLAQATAARTEAGFFVVRAPYDGVVAELPVSLGDMAMPGRLLATVVDPRALRVTAAVAASALPTPLTGVQVELDGLRITPKAVQVLPSADPHTHTLTVRAELPAGTVARPGQFARLHWAAGKTRGDATAETGRLSIPRSAVMRRAELTAVYVLVEGGSPVLRQVRLGPVQGDRVEVLSGLRAGEAVVVTPQAAARAPAGVSR